MGTVTGQLDTRAGNGSVSIDDSPLISSPLPDGTIEVGEIGELSIEFDMRDTASDADTVFYAPTQFKVSFFDYIDDGTTDGKSLFNILDDLQLDDRLNITLDFTTDGGHSWDVTFTMKISDAEYKREARTVEIEAKRKLEGSQTITEVFNSNFNDVYNLHNEGATDTRNCSPAYEFIKNAMGNALDYQTYINHSNNFDDSYDAQDDANAWVIIDGYEDDNGRTSETNASRVLFRLGALDGSIMGSMLGYNFFVHRLHTGDNESITEDDVEELTVGVGDQSYNTVFVFANRHQPDAEVDQEWGMDAGAGHLIGSTDGLNDFAPQSLELYFYVLEATLASWNDSGSDFSAEVGFEIGSTGASLLSDAPEGSTTIFTDSDPNLSRGDVITFSGSGYRVKNYLVESSTASRTILANPLKDNIEGGTSVNVYTDGQSTAGSKLDPVCQDGADAYANAYGADGENRIEIKIYDIDTFDPYQTFTTNSSFPDGVANNEYRPSELTYNLIDDLIESKAYKIG